jgi:hypothetical protein
MSDLGQAEPFGTARKRYQPARKFCGSEDSYALVLRVDASAAGLAEEFVLMRRIVRGQRAMDPGAGLEFGFLGLFHPPSNLPAVGECPVRSECGEVP